MIDLLEHIIKYFGILIGVIVVIILIYLTFTDSFNKKL